jgi:two-component system response regulator DesR
MIQRTRLVIADDDEPTRLLLQALVLLVPEFDLVGVAADGTEAVDLAQRHAPDLVVLDVEMPGMDGFAAAEAIAASLPDTRVLLHTGDDDGTKQRKARALGLKLVRKGDFTATLEAATGG